MPQTENDMLAGMDVSMALRPVDYPIPRKRLVRKRKRQPEPSATRPIKRQKLLPYGVPPMDIYSIH